MALHQPRPPRVDLERVQALTGIARVVLDVRIVTGLLAMIWLTLGATDESGVLLATAAGMGWLLLVLLRWNTVGWVLCTHPAVLALDAVACFTVLALTRAASPMLLLVGAGALFTGVCLDRRGARFFSPLYVAGWWMVLSTQPPADAEAPTVFWQLVLIPALLVGALFLGAGIRAVVLRVADAERRVRTELRTAGIAEERARMARELHDSLTKSLHGLAMLADSLPLWIDRAPDRAAGQASQLAGLIRNAGQESRAMILAMRRADATMSLTDQVRGATQRWRTTAGREVELVVSGSPALSTESGYELVAILGEALENVRRHTAESTAVRVDLGQQDSWVELVVADRGPGLPTEHVHGREGHFGVLGMHERAARVGGQLQIASGEGAETGTIVTVRLPALLEDEWDAAETPARADPPTGAVVSR